jgi:hypothetical protein
MTARAGIGIGPGDPVEVAWENKRFLQIGKRIAGTFLQRPTGPFLGSPARGEQLSSEVDQIPN